MSLLPVLLLSVAATDPVPELEQAVKLLHGEDYAQAALAAHELVGRADAALALDARMVLAKSLYRMGLYHAAQSHYAVVLAAGPTTKHFKKALEWSVFVSRKTVGHELLLNELAKQPESELPDCYRTELYWLLAKWHAEQGRALDAAGRPEAQREFSEARRLARLVPSNDAFAPRAKYVEALADLRDDRLADAVQGFKQVLRLTSRGDEVRDLAMMQLARTAYAQQQDAYAVAYYGRVPRESKQWLDAVFEASWAQYRLGDDDRALGNLVTLAAPFFQGEYYPEAWVIRAIVHYENCGFPEARKVLDDFEGIYRPVYAELESLTARAADPAALYDRLEGGEGPTARLMKLARAQPEVASAEAAIGELEHELEAIEKTEDAFRYSSLVQALQAALKSRRDALRARAGTAAARRLELEKGELSRLLQDALRIRFEVTEREKVPLEEQLRGRKVKADELVSYEFSREVSEDEAYWPQDGEYWRDELGTYLFTLRQGCAPRRAGGAVSSR